jgi:hypothetical protein
VSAITSPRGQEGKDSNLTAFLPRDNDNGENGLSKVADEINAVFSIVNATVTSRACSPRKLPDDIGHLVSH